MFWPSRGNSRCQRSCKLCMPLTKKFWIKISQIVLNSGDCFEIGAKILRTKKFLQVWEQIVIRRCSIWRIGTMVQFDKPSLSNSSLNNVALIDEDVVMKKHHSTANFAAPFLHNDRTQPFNDWCIIRIIDRDSTWQNAVFIPKNDHHNLSSWSFLVESSWRLFTLPLADLGFQLPQRTVVVNPGLFAGYDGMKKVDQIYFALDNNAHNWHTELVSTISVATVCKPSSCPIDCPWSHGRRFLEWPICKLGDGQRLVDHTLRSVLRLQCSRR